MTKLYQKKLDFLHEIAKQLGIEVKISAKTENPYISFNSETKVTTIYHSRTVTKSTIDKLGVEYKYPTSQDILILTSKGRFKHKASHSNMWKNPAKLGSTAPFYYFNRKCKWLMDYPLLRNFKICEQFTDIKSLKEYLGCEFMSDTRFTDVINSCYADDMIKNRNRSLLFRKFADKQIYINI